jgi:hypothetical protein
MAWIELNATMPAAPEGARNVHFRQEGGHSGAQGDPIPTSAYLEDQAVGGGGNSVVAREALAGQTEELGPTTLFTPDADGLYRISVYQNCTVGGSEGSLATKIGWTDDSQAQLAKPAPDIQFGDEILDRGSWSITATNSEGSHPPEDAIDADLATYWWSGADIPQSLMVDMGSPQTFNAVSTRNWTSQTGDKCKGFDVYVSDDGLSWGSPVGSLSGASGSESVLRCGLDDTYTKRYLKVTFTESTAGWLQLGDLQAELGEVAGAFEQGAIVVWAKADTDITYQTILAGVTGSPEYSLYITVESLGDMTGS